MFRYCCSHVFHWRCLYNHWQTQLPCAVCRQPWTIEETCLATLLLELPAADAEFPAAGPGPEHVVAIPMPPADLVPRCCQHRDGPPEFALIGEWAMRYIPDDWPNGVVRHDRWLCYTCNRCMTREDIVRRFGPPPSTLWCGHHGRRQAASIDIQTFRWTATCVQQGGNYCIAVPCTCVLEDIRENEAEVITIDGDDEDVEEAADQQVEIPEGSHPFA